LPEFAKGMTEVVVEWNEAGMYATSYVYGKATYLDKGCYYWKTHMIMLFFFLVVVTRC